MAPGDFVGESSDLYAEHGSSALRSSAANFLRKFGVRAGMTRGAFSNFETVLDDEWNLFSIPNGCRYDPFRRAEATSTTAGQQLQRGERSRDRIREDYVDNLRWVLGEFWFYGHGPYLPLEAMRRVPRGETVATDDATYEPRAAGETVATDVLEDLGHR